MNFSFKKNGEKLNIYERLKKIQTIDFHSLEQVTIQLHRNLEMLKFSKVITEQKQTASRSSDTMN